MLDTLYPALVAFVTIALGLAPGLWPEQFKRRPYQITVGICAILLGLGTYAVMEHERRKSARERAEEKHQAEVDREAEQRKAAIDREAAIQETSARVSASTVASVSDVLGRQFAKTLSEVRGMRKDTVASAAEVHAIWQRDQTGEQKRQDIRDRLQGYASASGSPSLKCSMVSAPGRGGTSAQSCIDDARAWIEGTTGYISGSLGEKYVSRFRQAGARGNSEAPNLEPSYLDPNIAVRVYWARHELEAKVDALKEFIKELGK
jgi:hypothetical protein